MSEEARNIYEIQAEHSAKASEILSGYHTDTDRIKSMRDIADGPYTDRLTAEQRSDILREQKMEMAGDVHQSAREAYTAQLQHYHGELAERTAFLKERLFKVAGPDGAAALSRTVMASDGELSAFLDIAIQADNKDLARAVFVAAERKGSGDLVARYFDEVDGDARELYQEYAQVPPAQVLERQRENVDTVIPQPDALSLEAPARVNF